MDWRSAQITKVELVACQPSEHERSGAQTHDGTEPRVLLANETKIILHPKQVGVVAVAKIGQRHRHRECSDANEQRCLVEELVEDSNAHERHHEHVNLAQDTLVVLGREHVMLLCVCRNDLLSDRIVADLLLDIPAWRQGAARGAAAAATAPVACPDLPLRHRVGRVSRQR